MSLPVSVQNTALKMQQADDISHDRRIGLNVTGRLEVAHVAAHAGEILVEGGEDTGGWILVVVERVVGQRIANR